ncbi:MAG: DUF2079 domain-containing protein [Chloroflexaceae bacterium]|nr:DUF2079 domain-containing protein [Chloroflexaceae bacterium]
MTMKPAIPGQRQSAFDPFLWGGMLLIGAVLAWLSIARYLGYNAGMLDLGNMAQAIGSVLRGQPLIFTFHQGATSRLAYHVELIYFLLALPYALWPDPRLLLMIQAVLFVLGAIPVYRIALRRTRSHFAARSLALIYLFYPTAQTSVLFDFHGDTLGMPLLLFALDALDERVWWRYGLFVALALSTKFYVALVLVLLGPLIWWYYRERQVALITTAVGLLYGIVAFFVIRPLFTTASTSEVHQGLNYITFYFGQLQLVLNDWLPRLIHSLVVFGPAMLLAWRGWPWLLPGLPIAAAMLISTAPGPAYDYRYHHYALVVPFIVMAAIEGTVRLQQRSQTATGRRRNWRGPVGLTLGIVILSSALLVDTPMNVLFWRSPPGWGLDSSVYGITPRDAAKDAFLAAHVPDDADLAASTFVATHLTNRDTLYLVRYADERAAELFAEHLQQVDGVVADALFDYRVFDGGDFLGGSSYEQQAIGMLLQHPEFGLVAARDGLLWFERGATETERLTQTWTYRDYAVAPTPLATFDDRLVLYEAQLEPLGDRRWQAEFVWGWHDSATSESREGPGYVAVSTLEGVDHERIVHLPTFAMLPTPAWPADAYIVEQFVVELSPDIPAGEYQWQVSWYDLRHSEAYATDERSRVGDVFPIGTITVQ